MVGYDVVAYRLGRADRAVRERFGGNAEVLENVAARAVDLTGPRFCFVVFNSSHAF